MKAPELDNAQIKTIAFIIISIIVLYIVYVLLKRVGLIRTSKQKEVAKIKDEQNKEKAEIEKQLLNADLLNPNFQNSSSVDQNLLLSDAAANNYASTLHDSMRKFLGIIMSNANEAIGVFQELTYAPQVSQIAQAFEDQYGLSLSSTIQDYFSKADLINIYSIINKIPK